jgi:hypothetical protein
MLDLPTTIPVSNSRSKIVAGLGGIQFSNESYQTDGIRPPFKSFVTNIMKQYKMDRCHSISYELISSVLCDFLNNLAADSFSCALSYLTDTFADALSSVLAACDFSYHGAYYDFNRTLENLGRKLEAAVSSDQKNDIITTANNYLYHINSAPDNLRYPKNPDYHWNQSVSSSFDPFAWCYIEEALVMGDESCYNFMEPIPCTDYKHKYYGILPTEPKDGLYFVDIIDGFRITRLLCLGDFLNTSYLHFLTAQDVNENKFAYSSSNDFPIPESQPCPIPVFYYCSGPPNMDMWLPIPV